MISLLLLLLAQPYPTRMDQGVGLKDGGSWTVNCTNCSGGGGGSSGGGTIDGGDVRASQGLGEDGGRAWNVVDKSRPVVTVEFDGGFVSVANFPATQAVSATALPLPTGASTEATLALIKAKTDNLDVLLSTRTKSADSQTVTGTVTAAQGLGEDGGRGWDVHLRDRPVVVVEFDGGFVTALQGGGPWAIQFDGGLVTALGSKTNNNAAPGASNLGVLDGLANAAPPTWVEGNQVGLSQDLAGNLRVVSHAPNVLGCWSLNGNVAYTATTVNGIIFSMRWGDATRFALILKVSVAVIAVAFTTLGLVERQLVFVRSFTASDSAGTALTPAANQNELRTSFATSLLTDARIGGFLTAGTGTADTNPLASVPAWMGAVGNVIGGGSLVPLWDASSGFQYPIVLAQNEGIRVRLGAAETASTRQTFVNVVWCEINAY